MTERLYYDDPFLTSFHAEVVEFAGQGRRVYLDRTAFYPSSGGQPFDTGTLDGIPVVDVIEEEDRIAHMLAAPLAVRSVEGILDWTRRFDHMQQHTGQHLLSAVLEELYRIPTLSFHLGQDTATIDAGAASLSQEQVIQAERRANEVIWENRPVVVSYEHSSDASELRKPSQRQGILRIVSIAGLDRSACGGTHVRGTAAIGLMLIRGLDRIRGNVRIEFVCGGRALARARQDYGTLSEISKTLSAPFDQTPALVTAAIVRAQELDKARRKLATELAAFRGRQLYDETPPGLRGVRKHTERGAIDDETRTLARNFTARPQAVFLAVSEDPASVLLAISKDCGFHAGDTLKKALAETGGRGGGNPQIAQGSVPSREALELLLMLLEQALG
ncbi:MAG: alanyl-tRNA editing protein [Acidobacteria bacterium]|nr:alanyl-tRNA editing protein [Acidobacteriota bacterium]